MKQGWEIKTLLDVSVSIEDGDWIEKKDQSSSGVRLIQTGNVGQGYYKDKGEKAKYISEDTFVRLKCTELTIGDILVSRLPDPVGRACILPALGVRCITAVDCSIIKLKQDIIHPQWFVYYSLSSEYAAKVNKECSGTTRDRISRKKLSCITIPIPPLAEQERIVEILDREFEKINALKTNTERSLQHAKDLFQSALKQELQPKEGWTTRPLSDVCVITSSKRIFKSEYVSDGIPFYRTKEVKEIANNSPISVELYISNERYNEIKKKFGVPQINDLLVSAVGTIGEIMVVTDDKPFYFKDGNLVWLKEIQGVHSWSLKYYLKSIIDDIKNMTRGAAYNALTIEKFQTMNICFSSIAEQEQIVARLDKLKEHCQALEENYKKTIALCDDMKQALLRKAFNGEL